MALGGVLDDGDEDGRGFGAGEEEADFDGVGGAVLAVVGAFEGDEVFGAGAEGGGELLEGGGGEGCLEVEGGEFFEFVEGIAEVFAGALVDAEEAEGIGVEDVNFVEGGVEDAAEAFVEFLGFAAGGDVEGDTGHSERFAGGVAEDVAHALQPADGAVGADEAVLDFVGFAVVEGAFDLEGEVFAVVGVDVAEIGFVAAIELGEGDAEEAGDAVGSGDFAGGDVPGPDAHAGGVERELELGFGIAMGGLGLLAFSDCGGDDEGGDGGDGDEHLEKPDIVHIGTGGERALLLGGGDGGNGGNEEVGVGGTRGAEAQGGPDEEGEGGKDEGGVGVRVFPAADEYEVGDDPEAGKHGGGLGEAWGGPAVGARSGGGEEDGGANEAAEEVADGPGFEGRWVGGPGG